MFIEFPILSIIPANNERNVPIATEITVKFAQAMDDATLTPTNVYLANSNGTSVASKIVYTPEKREVTLTPAAPLESSHDYRLVILGGKRGVQSIIGEFMLETQYFDFQTEEIVVAPPPPEETGDGEGDTEDGESEPPIVEMPSLPENPNNPSNPIVGFLEIAGTYPLNRQAHVMPESLKVLFSSPIDAKTINEQTVYIIKKKQPTTTLTIMDLLVDFAPSKNILKIPVTPPIEEEPVIIPPIEEEPILPPIEEEPEEPTEEPEESIMESMEETTDPTEPTETEEPITPPTEEELAEGEEPVNEPSIEEEPETPEVVIPKPEPVPSIKLLTLEAPNLLSITIPPEILEANTEYTVVVRETVKGVDGTSLGEVFSFSFITTLVPLYGNPDRIKADISSFLRNVSDSALYLYMHEASVQADNIMSSYGTPIDAENVPYYVEQYVRYQTAYDLVLNASVSSGTSSAGTRKLGDLTITQESGASSDLSGILRELKDRIKPYLDQMHGRTNRGYARPAVVSRGEAIEAYPEQISGIRSTFEDLGG